MMAAAKDPNEAACSDLTNAAGGADRIANGKEVVAKEDEYVSLVIVHGESVDVGAADPEEKRSVEEKAAVGVDAGPVVGEMKVELEVGEERGGDAGFDEEKVKVEEEELKEEEEENRECCMDNGHDVEFCGEYSLEVQESEEGKGGSGECSSDDVMCIKISEEYSESSRVEVKDLKGEEEEKGECGKKYVYDADHSLEVVCEEQELKEKKKEKCGSCEFDDKVECQEVLKDEELVADLEASNSKEEENGIVELQGLEEENGEFRAEENGDFDAEENGKYYAEENGECYAEESGGELVCGLQKSSGEDGGELVCELQGSEENGGELVAELEESKEEDGGELAAELQELKEGNAGDGEDGGELAAELQESKEGNAGDGEHGGELAAELLESKEGNAGDGEDGGELAAELLESKEGNVGDSEDGGELAAELPELKEGNVWDGEDGGELAAELPESKEQNVGDLVDESHGSKEENVADSVDELQGSKEEIDGDLVEESQGSKEEHVGDLVGESQGAEEENVGDIVDGSQGVEEENSGDLVDELQGAEEENGVCHGEVLGEFQGSEECHGGVIGEELKVESYESEKSRDNEENVHDVDDNLECSDLVIGECCEKSKVKSREIEMESRDNGDCSSGEENRELCNEKQESCQLKVDKGENGKVDVNVENKDEVESEEAKLESAAKVEDDREPEVLTSEVINVPELKNQPETDSQVIIINQCIESREESLSYTDGDTNIGSESTCSINEKEHQFDAAGDSEKSASDPISESLEAKSADGSLAICTDSSKPQDGHIREPTPNSVDPQDGHIREPTPNSVDEDSVDSAHESMEVNPPASDSTQEGPISAVSDSTKVDGEVGKRMPCFMIKVPRYINDKNNLRIDHAAQEVDKRTQHRDSFRDAIKLKRDSFNECRDILESARSEEKAARSAILAKRQEISTLQATINKMKDATSIDEIEEKIHSMEHKIEHETMSLKEEKQLIRDIKQLKKDREELCAKTGAQSEFQDTFDQKDDIEKRFKSLKQELDSLRPELSRAENVTKLAKQKFDAEYKSLYELKEKFKDADVLRQEAYEHLVNLRRQSFEKNKYFRMYNEDKKIAWNYASTGSRDALQSHCHNQVEKILELWNNDDEFRNDYVKNNVRSTLRRLNTLDGRSLGPDEKPPVLDVVEERTGNAIAVTSYVQENQATPLVTSKSDTKPTSDAVQKNALIELKKPNKISNAESGQIAVPARVDMEEQERQRIRAKVEEEEARKADEEARKQQELARREQELRKEEAAARLKEQRKLEEKAKAKEAEERKRRNAEKAQARAESRAKREAELKEKEREKRLRRKEKKKAALASDGTSGSREGESAPIANPSTPETNTKELEVKEKSAMAAKRPSKPLPAAKQQMTPRPLPMPLRNRGKRKMQPWMWVLAVSLLFFTLFFVANFFELSVPKFGF